MAGLALSFAPGREGRRLAEILYHVVLEGRRLGPYDRRTIVGMRVRNTLGSEHLLEATDGERLTVAELLHGTLPETPAAPPAPAAPPEPAEPPAVPAVPAARRGYSVIQAVHTADLLQVQGRAYDIPAFKGEVELRVQTRVLRIAGRFRGALGWKEDRVKLPLQDIIHARLQGSLVELGVRPAAGEGLQRLRLQLRTPAAARELVEGLPHTVPWPGSEPLAAPGRRAKRRFGRGALLALLALAALLLAVIAIQARAAAQKAGARPGATITTAGALSGRIMAATRSGSRS